MDHQPNPTDARQQILDDHRQIGELLSRVAATSSPSDVTACLQQLLPLLQRHFREEEDEIDGLHAQIQRQTPQHVHALQQLRREHGELLESVRQLLATAQAARGEDSRLRERGVQLKDELAAHETRETELFVDSIWTDFGAGD